MELLMKIRKLEQEKLREIRTLAQKARAAILKMTTLAGSGHPGGQCPQSIIC